MAKKKNKERKQVYSVTLDQSLVFETLKYLDSSGNFSKHVGEAIEFYNKHLEKEKK